MALYMFCFIFISTVCLLNENLMLVCCNSFIFKCSVGTLHPSKEGTDFVVVLRDEGIFGGSF